MKEKSLLYNYIIVIRNENKKLISLLGFLLSFISLLLFAREMVAARTWNIAYLLGIVFISALIMYNLLIGRRSGKEIYYSKALLIAGLVWMKMPYGQWLIFVFIILAFLEYQARMPLEIGFSADEIVFNSLFRKRFHWSDLNNVVLKDGLLTIDFKSDKIFQRLIDDGESEASEEEFNEWAVQKLEMGNGKLESENPTLENRKTK